MNPMQIKDSGHRREFETGAVRDVAEGKGRCDLLPLGVVGDLLNDELLRKIEVYVWAGKVVILKSVLWDFARFKDCDWPTLFLEVSKHFEDGCSKYGERNWQKGIPLHCYIDSAVRHYLQYIRGDRDEPHDRAFVWNILCAIWTHENKPEMIDLPFRESRDHEGQTNHDQASR